MTFTVVKEQQEHLKPLFDEVADLFQVVFLICLIRCCLLSLSLTLLVGCSVRLFTCFLGCQ